MLRLLARSIWAHDAIPLSEWKYRNLKRVWLPLYDVLAIAAGLSALAYGSRLLNRVLGTHAVDAVGAGFAVVAFVCLIGSAFPRLWLVAIIGKLVLVGIIVAYMAAIIIFPSVPDEAPNWFIVVMLAFGLPLACFQLNMLGEEWKDRRADAAAEAPA
jgi:hypothetical protein